MEQGGRGSRATAPAIEHHSFSGWETREEAAAALAARGVAVPADAPAVAVRAALRAQFTGAGDARAVFAALDLDGSGALDRAEVEQAIGMLGAHLGALLGTAEQAAAFRAMDPDGDGEVTQQGSAALSLCATAHPLCTRFANILGASISEATMRPNPKVTFEEFEVWWKEQETVSLLADMDEADVREALAEGGVQVAAGADLASMRAALVAQQGGRAQTAAEAFRRLDADGSGYLDREELAAAAGLVGAAMGVLASAEEQAREFEAMDPDGDGEVTQQGSVALSLCTTAHPLCTRFANILGASISEATMRPNPKVTFEEFEVWWKEREIDALLSDMGEADVREALAEAGVVAEAGAPPEALRAALRIAYAGKKMSVRQCFDWLDADASGELDEVRRAPARWRRRRRRPVGRCCPAAFATPLHGSRGAACSRRAPRGDP
jgi:Ca2+-binding EF-hand superfamily protein